MRRNSGGRGRYDDDRGGGGRGRGYRDDGGRGGRGGGGRRRGRGGRGRHNNKRQSAESGNRRERIAVESGFLVLIDQFMLANPQFVERLEKLVDADPVAKDDLVREFGGLVVEIEPGTYRIERDPFAASILIHQGAEGEMPTSLVEQATDGAGTVFVDTRCLAMIDRELLDDAALIQKYQQLWFNNQEKACRDLLRDNGGAVRYGFSRFSDDLIVTRVPGDNVICLRPEHVERGEMAEGEAAPAA